MWFRIDPSLALPIYLQLVRQVEDAMASGILGPGDRLPPVRELAVEAAINPNTVARAYRILEARGLLETRRGAGSFIREAAGQLERDPELVAQLDHLLELARARGLDDAALMRLVERRILGGGEQKGV